MTIMAACLAREVREAQEERSQIADGAVAVAYVSGLPAIALLAQPACYSWQRVVVQ